MSADGLDHKAKRTLLPLLKLVNDKSRYAQSIDPILSKIKLSWEGIARSYTNGVIFSM